MAGDAKRYLKYLASEREASRMYRALAEVASGDPREALLELADIEDKHAKHWEELLIAAGETVPPDTGDLDPQAESIIARAKSKSLFSVLPELEQAEIEAQGTYDDEPDALPGMAEDERLHAQVLAGMQNEDKSRASTPALLPTDSPGRTIGDLRASLNSAEPWHHTDKSGSLRASVFGVSDGLVSNTALVMGFAGSGISSGTVLFAGIAGLLAGAFSMAAGEYVSVSSQRDLFAHEIEMEAAELREKPLEEQRELELIYRAKGFDRQMAKAAAKKIMADPDTALDTLAREELGLDPDELGAPIKVAISSFISFAIGAAVPTIPYFFASGTTALIIAIVFALIALTAVGATVGKLAGSGMVRSALRQVLVGSAAAAVTYIIGRLIGTGLG